MKKINLLILTLVVAAFVIPAAAQTSFGGNWEWKSRANKNKEQSVVWVTIKQKGSRVTGNYAFAQLIDGENDGADSSFVPFTGTLSGTTLTIEFNPDDIHGIEEDQDTVRYKKIKSPATAALWLKNGKLEWIQTKGKLDAGDLSVSSQMILNRLR
ncbi:MAG TPA: hypothetical protein VGC97_22955 [Pyrinomonadaceae bacterium]|jgi:hypothetical protein